MTLYELFKETESDYDCYDTEFDMCVTVCLPEEVEDTCDLFCTEMAKRVEVVEYTKGDCVCICDWYHLIEANIEKFREFANKFWYKNNHEDKDDFIEEWINELHLFFAGYGCEENYNELNKLVSELESPYK